MADYTLATGGTLDLSTEANTDGNSNQTNDTIVGSSGDDKIIAGASTPQPYIVNPSAPVDHQVVGTVQDNDTIVEASGNNTLTGGYGNDKFVFNIGFGVEQQTLHYDDIHQTPTQVSGANTNGVWNSYLSNLNEWRAEMTALYGQDQNTSDVQTQNYTYGAKNQQSGSATYDDNFTYSAVHTNTSTNTINDYGNGHDSIVLAGVTQEQFDAYGGGITHNDDGSSTIHIGTFSITVLGATLSESDLTFQTSAWS